MDKLKEPYTTRFGRTLKLATAAAGVLASFSLTSCGDGGGAPPVQQYDATDEGEMTEAEVKSLMGGAQRSSYTDGPGEESVFTLEGIVDLARRVSYPNGNIYADLIDQDNEVNIPGDGLNAVEYWNIGQNAYRAACRGPDKYHVAGLNLNRTNADNFYSAVVARSNP